MLQRLCLALMATCTACVTAPVPTRPNVLVITSDTTRRDHLGCYGYGVARTPHIDRLAQEGVRFDNATTPAPVTLPAHTSLFTGLLPVSHGIHDNGAYAASDTLVTLAEVLQERGYHTGAFVSAAVLDQRYNLAQGFSHYDDNLEDENKAPLFMIRDRPAHKTASRALSWLEAWKNDSTTKPFFAWVHFFDPHQPYELLARFAPLAVTPYDAEISAVDAAVGRLIDALRDWQQLDNTVVVFLADHGESLGEHGEKTHALFIYDGTMRIPLIMRYPSHYGAGSVYTPAVRNVDVMPTVLASLGIDVPHDLDGENLLPMVLGDAPPRDLPQYCESRVAELGFGMAPLAGIRRDGMKYIRAPHAELYDLVKDPKELRNLAATKPDLVASLEAEVTRTEQQGARHGFAGKSQQMDEETLQMLTALGYVSRPELSAVAPGMDPKDGLPLHEALESARHAGQRGNWSEMVRRAEALVHQMPKNISARGVLAMGYTKLQRQAEARAQYNEIIAIDPRQARFHFMLGHLERLANNRDDARREFREALQLEPSFQDAKLAMGALDFESGDMAGAHTWFANVMQTDWRAIQRLVSYGDEALAAGRYDLALRYYDVILQSTPDQTNALNHAGLAALQSGDLAQAMVYLTLATEQAPENATAQYNLACTLARSARSDEALEKINLAAIHGFSMPDLLLHDSDLVNLQDSMDLVVLRAEMLRNADAKRLSARRRHHRG